MFLFLIKLFYICKIMSLDFYSNAISLKPIYDYDIFGVNNEWCYNIDKVGGYYRLINKTGGDSVDGRKFCNYKYHSSFILHTHPSTSWAYPSFEDINKVFKRDLIKKSIIATKWGVWELNRVSSKRFDGNDPSNISQKKYIITLLDKLGNNTRESISVREKFGIKSRDYGVDVEEHIYNFIQKMNKQYRDIINISFKSWNRIIELDGYILYL